MFYQSLWCAVQDGLGTYAPRQSEAVPSRIKDSDPLTWTKEVRQSTPE